MGMDTKLSDYIKKSSAILQTFFVNVLTNEDGKDWEKQNIALEKKWKNSRNELLSLLFIKW
jgi:hypothetical protein